MSHTFIIPLVNVEWQLKRISSLQEGSHRATLINITLNKTTSISKTTSQSKLKYCVKQIIHKQIMILLNHLYSNNTK
jgi:hypothetical protein